MSRPYFTGYPRFEDYFFEEDGMDQYREAVRQYKIGEFQARMRAKQRAKAERMLRDAIRRRIATRRRMKKYSYLKDRPYRGKW